MFHGRNRKDPKSKAEKDKAPSGIDYLGGEEPRLVDWSVLTSREFQRMLRKLNASPPDESKTHSNK